MGVHMENLNLEEKIRRNDALTCKIGYRFQIEDKVKLTDDEEKLVWNLIDFGYEREQKIMRGECSISASLSFSMEKWEERVDRHYTELKAIEDRILNSVSTYC